MRLSVSIGMATPHTVSPGQRLRHARVYAEALAVVVADDEKEMQRFERQMEKQRRELKRLS